MSGELLFVIHPEPEVRETLGRTLHGASYKVLGFGDGREAEERIDHQRFLLPDAILMPLAGSSARGDGDGPRLLGQLRAHPLTETIPVVVLGDGSDGERRRALRLGLTSIVVPPYDGEEVVLTTRLALERHRDSSLVSGSIAQLSVTDLLQTAEAARKSGTFSFRSRGRTGTLWMSGGRIVDAEIDDGCHGRDAVFRIAGWREGIFEVDFSRVSVPGRIEESTSGLLLEAMRRADEAARESHERPPHAALEDPPPPPPREIQTVHRALTLVNVAVSYALDHAEATLVARRLETVRQQLEPHHPALALFTVTQEARVVVDLGTAAWRGTAPEELVRATGGWLRAFFERLERALPGRFQLARLGSITEAIADDLRSLGFDQALGLRRAGEDVSDDEEALP